MQSSADSMVRALLLGGFIAALGHGPALAGMDEIRAENNSAWIAAGTSHFNYSEFIDDGSNLDTERDWLGTLSGGVSVQGGGPVSFLPPNLYLAAEADGSWGDARYHGSLINGTPFISTTRETMWSARGRAGYSFPLSASATLIPYAEFGYRNWDRDLGGAQERYRNYTILGGLLAQYSPLPRTVFSVWGGVGESFSGHMTYTNPTLHFDLGDELTWNVGAKAGYSIMPHIELFTRLSYDRLEYGRSQDVFNPVAAAFYYEPKSETSIVTAQFGLAYSFQ